jgi:hypothetical protein
VSAHRFVTVREKRPRVVYATNGPRRRMFRMFDVEVKRCALCGVSWCLDANDSDAQRRRAEATPCSGLPKFGGAA